MLLWLRDGWTVLELSQKYIPLELEHFIQICVWHDRWKLKNLFVGSFLVLAKFIWIVIQMWHILSFVTVLLPNVCWKVSSWLCCFRVHTIYCVSQFWYFCRSSGRTQHNLFQLFSYCIHSFSLHTTKRNSIQENPTPQASICSAIRTHTLTNSTFSDWTMQNHCEGRKNANNHCRDKRTKLKQTFCNVAFAIEHI